MAAVCTQTFIIDIHTKVPVYYIELYRTDLIIILACYSHKGYNTTFLFVSTLFYIVCSYSFIYCNMYIFLFSLLHLCMQFVIALIIILLCYLRRLNNWPNHLIINVSIFVIVSKLYLIKNFKKIVPIILYQLLFFLNILNNIIENS